MNLPASSVTSIRAIITAVRDNLDRIETLLELPRQETVDDLDPLSPLNKDGRNLTARGAEVLYRLFDMGKNPHAVSRAMAISYGAAKYREHLWYKLGGPDRQPQPLD